MSDFHDTGTVTYFIQATDAGPIKIGKAKDPWKRLRLLNIGSPKPLKILATTPLDEAEVHARFENLRVRGEWFRPAEGLLRFIGEECVPFIVPARRTKRGGSRPGAGRKPRGSKPGQQQQDATYARWLILRTMRDSSESAAIRIQCALEVLRWNDHGEGAKDAAEEREAG